MFWMLNANMYNTMIDSTVEANLLNNSNNLYTIAKRECSPSMDVNVDDALYINFLRHSQRNRFIYLYTYAILCTPD